MAPYSDALISSQREFCPPLDSGLVAAMCSDLDSSPGALEDLREILSGLAAEAVVDSPSVIITTSKSSSHPSSTSGLQSPFTLSSASGNISSPLAFLRAAFPDLSVQVLQDAVDNASLQDETVDMQSIVEELLSAELLSSPDSDLFDEGNWEAAPIEKTSKKKGKQAAKPRKIIMGDVRQRQLMESPSQRLALGDQIDPWSQLSSLAEYISTLVPIPAARLLSSFHSPDYPTAFDALAAQMNSVKLSPRSEDDIDADLIAMTEMMAGSGGADEIDAQWARKCIQVTNGRIADAMDLYGILKEIKQLAPISHLKPPDLSRNDKPVPISSPTRSSTVPRYPAVKIHPTKPPPISPSTPSSSEWHMVEKRPPKAPQHHPHAEFIPAYRNMKTFHAATVPQRTIDEVTQKRAIEQSFRDKRAEALRKASQHWQRGQDGYARQVAGFYADEANRYLAESRDAAIELARAVVVRNRAENRYMGHNNENAIDLHGLTRDQALVIVREALASRAARRDGESHRFCLRFKSNALLSASKDEPLRFITGKGNHSAGNQSVLLPALQKALRGEGWKVREIEAGFVVHERA